MTTAPDMIGVVVDIHVVVAPAEQVDSSARWTLRCPVGHLFAKRGIELRRKLRSGSRMGCPVCYGPHGARGLWRVGAVRHAGRAVAVAEAVD